MTQWPRTNSVFLSEDVGKKYKPIVLSAPRFYSPKVKIHDWQIHSLSEPRDNKSGNFRQSTYKRLGSDDQPTGISETRSMTEQIHTKSEEEYRYRSLLNFYSFPLTETKDWEEAAKLIDLELPKQPDKLDYRTTLKNDFPPHMQTSQGPLVPYVPDIPWHKYRRTLGYSSCDVERHSGISKFWDEAVN